MHRKGKNMKELKHLGAYGLLIQNEKILLIKKATGPYQGKLDLPGGTIEFCEKPDKALKRELKEETGIKVTNYKLFDVDSVTLNWEYKKDLIKVHHVGIFYQILNYEDNIKSKIETNEINDDSLGASFYEIKKLTKNKLSAIAILELTKQGYTIIN